MAQNQRSVSVIVLALSALLASCQSSGQDASERRRDRAVADCEEAVRGQLASRATAQFNPDSEHVFYDSLGGAAVMGFVRVLPSPRKFACLLTPASESTWVLTAARFLD
ncbi:MAG: hypothetical protein ABI035_03880 [Gemmatimonadaceae bacterium]